MAIYSLFNLFFGLILGFHAKLNLDMAQIIKNFYYSARWNAFESITYKAILTIHQTCLFYFTTSLIYGFSSLLFATIYLTVELVNLGFDRSIAQFCDIYFNSKDNFKKYFLTQVYLQIGLLLSLLILIANNNYLVNSLITNSPTTLSLNICLLLAIIIICESARKTLRTIGQLLFLNKPMALVELSLILIYVILLWTCVLFGYSINLYVIYIPLLIQSIIGIFSLLYLILPKLELSFNAKNKKTKSLSWFNIIYLRFQNYLYQLSELLFSSNFLIYFFSAIVGVLNIGPIKLANYFAVFIKALLDKSFGLTSLALFARNKHLVASQKSLFDFAQKRLNFVIISLITFFGAITCFAIASGLIINNSYLALLFFGFTLINNFFIVYEQLFLINNKIMLLFGLNLISIASFILITHFYQNLYTISYSAHLIIILAILRVLILAVVKLTSKHVF